MARSRKARFWGGQVAPVLPIALFLAGCGTRAAPDTPTASVEAGIEASVADVRAANAAAARPLPSPAPEEPAAKR
jgi:hypothetical protein